MSSNVSFDLPKEEKLKADGKHYRETFDSFHNKPQISMNLPLIREAETMEMCSDPSQKLTGLGLEIASTVMGSLIAHPCLVLRRQCQVNKKALRYHLTPFTLIPVVFKLQNRQGIKTLWKGASGIFILRGIGVGLETIIAEVTPFPREVSLNSPVKHFVHHLLLKGLTYGILTPFLCSSLVETVQSDIASETPGVFDCIKEGFRRLFRLGTPQSIRLLPIRQLIGPTVAFCLANYILSAIVQSLYLWVMSIHCQERMRKQGAISKRTDTSTTKYFDDLSAIHFGRMFAEIALFPAETILNRLYLQGTRTIIDNLDTGLPVLPVITEYEGVDDCFQTVLREEGVSGLYKGFGALILEYTLQAVIIKTAKTAFQQITNMVSALRSRGGT